MRRLVYSPKAYAYIRTDGYPNGLDISEYIVSGEVNRVVNEVSTATITLRNPGKRFTQVGKPVFRPMDPITIFLARYQDKPVQTFTGFLDRTPYLQLFPGTCTIQASCTLKRLLHTYWDPALPFSREFLAKYGWVPFKDGSIANLDAEARKQIIAGTDGELTDSGFGGLLYAILQQVGNWRKDEIYVEQLPIGIVDDVVEMYKAFSDDNKAAKQEFSSLLEKIIGANSSGDGGGSDGGSVDLRGGRNVEKAFNYLVDRGLSQNQAAGAVGGMMGESGVNLSPTAEEGPPPKGYGIAQWSFGRRTSLESKSNFKSLKVQLDFLWEELQGNENTAFKAIRAAHSLEAAVNAWVEEFERPKNKAAAEALRLPYARSVLKSFGGSHFKKGDGSSTSSDGKKVTITNPKELIDRVVLPIARKHHIDVTPASVAAANATHGPTVSGGRSDHQGPPNLAWAADMADGTLTKNERALAEDLNKVFHMGWKMGDLTSHTEGGFRFQLIHGCSDCGGDHTTHVHFGVRKDSPHAKWVGVPGADASSDGSGGGGSSSNSDGNITGTATAAAFATELEFPSLEETSEAILLQGGKSLMNDQPLFPFVEQLSNASMRSFQSLPNGNFFSFFPDYFGNYFHRKPYWRIADIEILDGKIELTDDALATHVYVVGDTIPYDGINIVDKLMSGGVVTVFNAFQGKNWIVNHSPDKPLSAKEQKKQAEDGGVSARGQQDAINFLQKYGARPLLIEDPLIRSPYFEAFMAVQKFQLAWSRQFLTTFQLTFMPELYPGGIVAFEEHHGIQCYIDSVTHSWDYESGFTTTAQLSAPAAYGGGTDLALGMIQSSSGGQQVGQRGSADE